MQILVVDRIDVVDAVQRRGGFLGLAQLPPRARPVASASPGSRPPHLFVIGQHGERRPACRPWPDRPRRGIRRRWRRRRSRDTGGEPPRLRLSTSSYFCPWRARPDAFRRVAPLVEVGDDLADVACRARPWNCLSNSSGVMPRSCWMTSGVVLSWAKECTMSSSLSAPQRLWM